jgi:hypothetical protein
VQSPCMLCVVLLMCRYCVANVLMCVMTFENVLMCVNVLLMCC